MPETYSVRELAAALGVSVRQLSRIRALDYVLPRPLPLPGHPKWSRTEIDRWLRDPQARRGLRRTA